MGLADVMAQPEPMDMARKESSDVHHVPSHSRESSTSSTASSSVASSCSEDIIQTAENLSSMAIYSVII